jgi:hypothetical protein
MESALLNDQSKRLCFLRGAEIGGEIITFCTPDIFIRNGAFAGDFA